MAKTNSALDALRSIDPNARILWDVRGPQDTNARICAILVKVDGERSVKIAEVNGAEFTLYSEDKTTEVSDGTHPA